jgi:hypothetical protein
MTRVVLDNGGTDWLTPVATLLAVLVGGFLNWIAQVKLADRRERADAEARTEQRKAEAEEARAERQATFDAHEAQRAADADAANSLRQSEEASARRIREADERAAARVVQGDLAMVASRLKEMTEDQRWMGFYRFALPSWGSLQLTLARAERLDTQEWEALSQSAMELREYDEGMMRTVGSGGPREGQTVVPADSAAAQAGITAMWQNATIAYNVLAKLGGVAAVTGLLHDET